MFDDIGKKRKCNYTCIKLIIESGTDFMEVFGSWYIDGARKIYNKKPRENFSLDRTGAAVVLLQQMRDLENQIGNYFKAIEMIKKEGHDTKRKLNFQYKNIVRHVGRMESLYESVIEL